ncbi:hypothetical protein [Paenibacillus crassostreae]|uniref:Uncharacterized protein n=1 Tax=Paenibacillus crassostreae TaxID=1763538 RepID=A0A162KRP9_9BACL|nr:hypothetical protein [Paenibacillus crassostreae]AOZ91583.1 hypothetical protein LPB68_04710 [Paenibacillus crassostreae]OAB72843.1 hypothetical protein PNBC_15540 [Paenibacillus crassostreae]
MNLPIGVVNEEGSIKTLVINEKLLLELSKKLRTEGVVEVHTGDDYSNLKTYKVQAIIQMAKGCKGHVMFIPINE